MNDRRLLYARIPVALEFPDEMAGATAAVLCGEYESGYFGERLSILDIGANVGAFAIWANMRWPHSIVHAYEPNPETFKSLLRNVGNIPNIICHDQAVYPSENACEPFYSRYAGDGEAGLASCMGRTFERLAPEKTFSVPIIHPRDLPKCDIVKLDVEGAEASILENMDLRDVSLVLLEFQNLENRGRVEKLLTVDFTNEFEDSISWNEILPGSEYRKDLAGNRTGHMSFANKRGNRLRKMVAHELVGGLRRRDRVANDDLGLKLLLSALPGAIGRALKRRLRGQVAAHRDRRPT